MLDMCSLPGAVCPFYLKTGGKLGEYIPQCFAALQTCVTFMSQEGA